MNRYRQTLELVLSGLLLALALSACGGGSSSTPLPTPNPAPTLEGLTPASALAGQGSLTLNAQGSGFIASSVLNWNGAPLPTTLLSPNQLSASVPASDLAQPGIVALTVTNPAPGGGTSSAQTFQVIANNPVPGLTLISPSSVNAGSIALSVTLSGTNFLSGSTVAWNGQPLTTQYVSATQLIATVPASDLAIPISALITVSNPAPGGGTSTGLVFSVNAVNPAPTLSSIAPTSGTVGSPALTLNLSGSNFLASSKVYANSTLLSSTNINSTVLTATLPANLLNVSGTLQITVQNPGPGGGSSSPALFTVNPVSTASIRQMGQYIGYPGSGSTNWNVTLSNVQAGSTLYVVGNWPNYASLYPDMNATDGTNTYTQLDRHDDLQSKNLGVLGTQSLAHWLTSNVKAGTYTINLSPTSKPTYEDWVAFSVFEITGVSANPVDGHSLNFQGSVPPGSNTLNVTVTNTQSTGLYLALTFNDVDYTVPTAPTVGPGFSPLSSGPIWDFTEAGKPSATAEFQTVITSGAHTATFSPVEATVNGQSPNYMTTGVIFH